jgi:arsenical pump membrane protein
MSYPAYLVLYAIKTPPLGAWMASFALPSAAAVAATFLALRLVERRGLEGACAIAVEQPRLSPGGWTALLALGLTAAVLTTASALGWPLGAPTAAMGALTCAVVLARDRASPLPVLKGVAWGVLVLVAGLFVMVEALDQTGMVAELAHALERTAASGVRTAGWISGGLLALACNLMNNLPAGLLASATLKAAHSPRVLADSLLIAVDLGPNLSVTGSLATILWLQAIRREGEHVGFRRFLKVGAVVMPPALLLALGARLLL